MVIGIFKIEEKVIAKLCGESEIGIKMPFMVREIGESTVSRYIVLRCFAEVEDIVVVVILMCGFHLMLKAERQAVDGIRNFIPETSLRMVA